MDKTQNPRMVQQKGNSMNPILYILMRTDMTSLNAGKAMAQASHATNAFIQEVERVDDVEIKELVEIWSTQTWQGFGTVLVLGCNETEMNEAVDYSRRDSERMRSFLEGVVHDPTYPVRDGEMTHYVPVDTCAFIFGDKDEIDFLDGLDLHD